MSVGRWWSTTNRFRAPRPSRGVLLALIVLVAAVVGVIVGIALHSVESGITAGALALSVLRDVLLR